MPASDPALYILPCVLYILHTALASQCTVPHGPHFYTGCFLPCQLYSTFSAVAGLLQKARSMPFFLSFWLRFIFRAHNNSICFRGSSMLADPSTDQPSPLQPVRFFGGLPPVICTARYFISDEFLTPFRHVTCDAFKFVVKLVGLCGPQLAESNIRLVLEWVTSVIVIVDCYLTCITAYFVCNICSA